MTRKIVSPDDIKDFSGHRIFEIFSSLRKDETDIDGAYPCDGREFSKSDFSGGNNPYDMLLLNKARTLSYAEYDAEIAENGICFAFALDTENEKFRIPKLVNNTVPQYSQTTDDIGTSEVLVTGSSSGSGNCVNGHHILEIFPTFRMEDEISGAWRCNGAEFSKSDFSGKDNPYTKIVELKNNLGPVVTFDYWNQIYQEKGYCSFFGLDETNEKFKIPYLNEVFLEATSDTEKIGEMKEAGLPNLTGNSDAVGYSRTDLTPTGVFSEFEEWASSLQIIEKEGVNGANVIHFDASLGNPIYGNSDTVQPKSFKVSYMVQLATEYGEISIADIKKEIYIGVLGQTVQSLLPINDNRLRLLNGDVLSKETSLYVNFIDYIASLQTDYPNIFTTEDDWQSQNTTYGSCGKFVYNVDTGTLRLPNISNILEGTTVIFDVGDLVEAGLPNITGYSNIAGVASKASPAAGCLEQNRFSLNYDYQAIQSSVNDFATVSINAALSNPIYGNSDTVQPQVIKVLTYIVVATSKTLIEEDIEQLKNDIKTAGGGIGVGTVVFTASSDPPSGFLKCDGSAVSRSLYPDLFSVIGTSYGEGDGSTTFNLPDSGYKIIEFDTSETNITAPGDGYIIVQGSTNQGGFGLRNLTKNYLSESLAERDWGLGAFIPCFKGDKIQISNYQCTINTLFFTTSKYAPFYDSDKGCLCIKAYNAAINEGNINIVRSVMPSGRFVNLQLPVSNTQFTMPSDGYLMITGFALSTDNGFINFINRTSGFGVMNNILANSAIKMFMPVRKDDIVIIEFNNITENTALQFFYAEGSKSE